MLRVFHHSAGNLSLRCGNRENDVFAKPQVPFASNQYEVSQVFYDSKDGTRVPMFVSSKKGMQRNGVGPTLMYAYCGFNHSLPPH